MKTFVRTLTLVGVSLLSAGVAVAAPDKVESPKNAVKRVAKAFGKLRSYQLGASVEVGEATGADSRIVTSTVSKRYQADVVGRLAKVESPRAYRPRLDALAGAIQAGAQYKSMLSTDDGRLLARLLPPPERFLAEASRYKRTAEWLDHASEADPDQPPARQAPVGDGDDDQTRTGDRDDPDESGADEQPAQPRHLRVTGPSTVALEHFISVTNSGCFSEG